MYQIVHHRGFDSSYRRFQSSACLSDLTEDFHFHTFTCSLSHFNYYTFITGALIPLIAVFNRPPAFLSSPMTFTFTLSSQGLGLFISPFSIVCLPFWPHWWRGCHPLQCHERLCKTRKFKRCAVLFKIKPFILNKNWIYGLRLQKSIVFFSLLLPTPPPPNTTHSPFP